MSYPYFKLYIDGEFYDGSAKRLSSKNPATNKTWAQFGAASPLDTNRAVVAAKAALSNPLWRDITQTARGKLLLRLADLIEEHADVIAEYETKDSGKLLKETATQTAYVADYYRYFAGLADKIEGAVLPIDKPDMHVYTRPEPIGVVAAIVPWNAQMFLTATKLGPALAAGCTVVLKASEIAPTPLLEFAKLIDRAGFPPGVVNVITGDAQNCAIPLTTHPDIDRIAFTGGPETARHVVRNSAENLAVTTLELGGKSPIIVFEDADIENAINGLIAGNYGASGQSCVAGSRAIVARSISDEVIERLTERAANIKLGDPNDEETHIGPLCTATQITNIKKGIAQSQRQGARVIFGGKPLEKPGNYMPPTLLLCDDKNTASLHTEFFGPILSMVLFDEEDEAIAFANDSVFGLGSGIFTKDIAKAHRVAARIHSGICWINTYRAISPVAPFGGYNQSGYAREAGQKSIEDYLRSKTVWVNLSDQPMPDPFVMR